MHSFHSAAADRLLAIEMELRALDLWEHRAPPASALASREPFCVDTLRFSQWLQFVLLPRMRELIEAGAGLPDNSSIAPMAEEALDGLEEDTRRLLRELEALDALLSGE